MSRQFNDSSSTPSSTRQCHAPRPPGGAVQLTRLVRQVAPCGPRHWSARWRRSAHRLVRQVAPFSSPDSFTRWRRVAHVTGPPSGAAQLTRLVLQVAPCRPRKSSARWRRAAHTTRVSSLRRVAIYKFTVKISHAAV